MGLFPFLCLLVRHDQVRQPRHLFSRDAERHKRRPRVGYERPRAFRRIFSEVECNDIYVGAKSAVQLSPTVPLASTATDRILSGDRYSTIYAQVGSAGGEDVERCCESAMGPKAALTSSGIRCPARFFGSLGSTLTQTRVSLASAMRAPVSALVR